MHSKSYHCWPLKDPGPSFVSIGNPFVAIAFIMTKHVITTIAVEITDVDGVIVVPAAPLHVFFPVRRVQSIFDIFASEYNDIYAVWLKQYNLL